MSMTNEQKEIQQKLQELNAASEAFDAADRALKDAQPSATSDDTTLLAAKRAQIVEQYVTAKEWLYLHTDGIIYDAGTNSFKLRNFQAAS